MREEGLKGKIKEEEEKREEKHEEKEEKEKEEEEQEASAHYSEQMDFGKHGPSQLRQQFNKGMTYFLVVIAALAVYFIILNLSHIYTGFMAILSALRSVIYGCVIAYLLNPLMKMIERHLRPFLEARMTNPKRAKTISRISSMLLSFVIVIAVIVALLNMAVPEIYNSIVKLVRELPGQMEDLVNRLNQLLTSDSTVVTYLRNLLSEGSKMLQNFVTNDLMPEAESIFSALATGVIDVGRELLNIVIGILISIYLLMGKETFAGQCKKSIYALFRADHANLILHIADKSNKIYSGFITGKIIDSFIIGCICFVCVTILRMPYTVLISVIIGVTNIIPFFGPIIGAIPCALLILLSSPIKALYFVILIIVLQQVDGNIIGPRILGNATGLPGFWVIVAIMLGGGLFGFLGMILGCPTFAVIYYIAQMLINYRLKSKDLPVGSENYDAMSYVNDKGKYVHSSAQAAAASAEAAGAGAFGTPENVKKAETPAEDQTEKKD